MTATASVCQWVCKMGDTEKNKKEKEPDKTVRVYLDNCAYNRPYDSQTQMKVELETQAKLRIQRLIKEGKIELPHPICHCTNAARIRIQTRQRL